MPELTPRGDGWNVLVLGHWDPLILAPAWLKEHVADGDVVVEMARDERMPPRQVFDGVSLLVVDNRLLVSPSEPDADGMKKAETVVLRLLELLPHTPITAVGVNVQLEGDVSAALKTADAEALAERGLREKASVLRRSFEHDGGGRVNVTLERREDGTQLVSINHHADARGAAAATEALRGQVEKQVQHALALAAAWDG